jgi:hypothetical protein
MGAGEVEGMEGVGWGVMGLLRLWKCVEKTSRVEVCRVTPTFGAGILRDKCHGFLFPLS